MADTGKHVDPAEVDPHTSDKVDVVAIPSLKATGEPDQTPGYVVFGEQDGIPKDREGETAAPALQSEQGERKASGSKANG